MTSGSTEYRGEPQTFPLQNVFLQLQNTPDQLQEPPQQQQYPLPKRRSIQPPLVPSPFWS
jgi:hypothetical protein